jgi:hypothetical protein
MPEDFVPCLGTPLLGGGRPDRWVELIEEYLRGTDAPVSRATYGVALVFAGRAEEARAVTPGILEACEAQPSPSILCGALIGFALAHDDDEPEATTIALRRAVRISADHGNQNLHSHANSLLARHEAAHGSTAEALCVCRDAMVRYYEIGNRTSSTTTLAPVLGSLLHRAGRDEPAAIAFGSAFAYDAGAVMATYPELNAAHDEVRAALGDARFGELAHRGAAMDFTELTTFALEQIDEVLDSLP